MGIIWGRRYLDCDPAIRIVGVNSFMNFLVAPLPFYRRGGEGFRRMLTTQSMLWLGLPEADTRGILHAFR